MKGNTGVTVTTALIGTLALVLVALACSPVFAQDAVTPRTPDGHPDLNGLWNDVQSGKLNPDNREFEKSQDGSILFDFGLDEGGGGGGGRGPQCVDDPLGCQLPNQPPYKPGYMEKARAIAATFYGMSSPLDPDMQCKPRGVPRGSVGGAMQFVQTPKVIAILYEGHPQPSSVYRIIYMDSPHPADLDPTYLGDSRGHWEGDTLVVDVAGLNDETWLAGGVGTGGGARGKYTTIHSGKEHVVERWTRKGNAITYEATVDDPVMFSRPWVMTPERMYLDTVPDDQLLELFCTPEATGGTHFIQPSEIEKKNPCGSLGRDQYDACVEAAKKASQK